MGPQQTLAKQLRQINPGEADHQRREQRGDHEHDDEFASHLRTGARSQVSDRRLRSEVSANAIGHFWGLAPDTWHLTPALLTPPQPSPHPVAGRILSACYAASSS